MGYWEGGSGGDDGWGIGRMGVAIIYPILL